MRQRYDLIIVGGGPGGATAGIYGARQGLKTLLISKDFGGQMARKAVSIENYPGFEEVSGLELIQKFERHLRKQKVVVEKATVKKIEKTGGIFSVLTDNKKQFQSLTVIIASGADPKPLGLKEEKKFIGRGLSYCVTCDGPIFSDRKVAVIGGGNAAFESAVSLSNYAKKIYILEHGSKVGADAENQERVKKLKNVEIITSAFLKKIEGRTFVEAVVYQDLKSKKLKNLQVEGVFVEIGYRPATSFINSLVDFNEKDEIKIDPNTNMTSTAGLFAAGDVTNVKYKQIVMAAGEGAKAALSAADYLQKK